MDREGGKLLKIQGQRCRPLQTNLLTNKPEEMITIIH